MRGEHEQHGVGQAAALAKTAERIALLADADGLDEDEVELAGLLQDPDGGGSGGGQAGQAAARGKGAEEHAVILRVNGGHAVAKDGAAGVRVGRIIGQDGDPAGRMLAEKARGQLINQRGFSRPARAGDADNEAAALPASRDNARWATRGEILLNQRDGAGEGAITLEFRVGLRRPGIITLDDGHDVLERRTREKDAVGALAPHDPLIGLGDGATTTAEDGDVAVAAVPELVGDLLEEDDVAAVVGRESDDIDVLLDGGPRDGRDRLVVAEVDDLDAMAGELDVDRGDGTVMAVADRHGREDAQGDARSPGGVGGAAWVEGNGHDRGVRIYSTGANRKPLRSERVRNCIFRRNLGRTVPSSEHDQFPNQILPPDPRGHQFRRPRPDRGFLLQLCGRGSSSPAAGARHRHRDSAPAAARRLCRGAAGPAGNRGDPDGAASAAPGSDHRAAFAASRVDCRLLGLAGRPPCLAGRPLGAAAARPHGVDPAALGAPGRKLRVRRWLLALSPARGTDLNEATARIVPRRFFCAVNPARLRIPPCPACGRTG